MLVIPMQRNRYNDGVKSPDITVTGLDYGRWAAWDRCHIGGLTENDHGRRTHGGPLERGPWAYSVTHALVIDNYGGSAREAESDLIVPAHTPFVIEGMPGLYQFTENPHHDSGPKLEKLP